LGSDAAISMSLLAPTGLVDQLAQPTARFRHRCGNHKIWGNRTHIHRTATREISSSLGKWPDAVRARSTGASGPTVVRAGGEAAGKYLP